MCVDGILVEVEGLVGSEVCVGLGLVDASVEVSVEDSVEVVPLEAIPLEADSPAGEGELADEDPESDGSAHTGLAAITAPTPNAAANAPTRPTYLAEPMKTPRFTNVIHPK